MSISALAASDAGGLATVTLSRCGTKSWTSKLVSPIGAALPSSEAVTDQAPRCADGLSLKSTVPPPSPLVGEARAAVLDAVRPVEDQRHRQLFQRIGARVAHEAGQMHRLAGPVDAALGVR